MTNRKGDEVSIDDRLADCEQRFEQLKAQREDHLKQADELLTEMNKCQGEYRVLQDLKEEKSKPNKKAGTIEAVPEEVK